MNPSEIGLEAEDLAQYCPNCRHPMIQHIDEAADWAICEALTGPYGGTQCKCNYATEAEKHEGKLACEGQSDQPDCCEPSHVVNSREWWQVVLWDEGHLGQPERGCLSKQEAEDDALLEFFAPTEKRPPDEQRVYGVLR